MQIGSIKLAVEELNKSGVVGMPTETVYGLGAKIDDPNAINKIFSTKKRPFFDPLIVHVADIAMAKNLTTDWSQLAQSLADKFWPGPLTMILPKSPKVNPTITSGLESVGIRMPRHPIALELIKQVGIALAAPSANRFGKTSPTKASHVQMEFPHEPGIIVDGGDCEVGLESTVLLIHRDQQQYQLSVLRAGAISESEISDYLNKNDFKFIFVKRVEKQLAPGQMRHHYMPETPLIVVQGHQTSNEILEIAKKKISAMPEKIEEVEIKKPQKFTTAYEIVLSKDPVIAARNFYAQLREAAEKQSDILFIRIGTEQTAEIWQPLMDRLFKAASLVI